MSIPPGGEIGEETSHELDQVLVVTRRGHGDLAGERSRDRPGTLVQVPAGMLHNVVNNGPTDLRLYTVYAPPEHAPGTIHRTKAEADPTRPTSGRGRHRLAPTTGLRPERPANDPQASNRQGRGGRCAIR